MEETKETTTAQEQQPADQSAAQEAAEVSKEKTFTQEEVNRIIQDRLLEERKKSEPKPEDEREKAIKARESRMDCRDYVSEKKIKNKLLDILDTDDFQKFKAVADALLENFPELSDAVPPPFASGTGSGQIKRRRDVLLENAFFPNR